MTQTSSYLVVVDDSVEFPSALRFAAGAARSSGSTVTLLSIVEPEGIEAWGGVERAMDDEAFEEARKKMAAHEKLAEELSGRKPVCVYKKGERRAVIVDYLEKTPSIAALVLAIGMKDGSNPLIHHLTSDKGLRKLNIPLIIVPEKM